ncbi:NACHT, LRR and PYD domains-containing protein 12-like [Petaurus breviceps papuanus]|uniref:NACHT, LRR and PYD domains-containing protein 12-like n=1 Tax=Petaurus breviceps papuanus TaxID=3040969 RepID=UPI0036DF4614
METLNRALWSLLFQRRIPQVSGDLAQVLRRARRWACRTLRRAEGALGKGVRCRLILCFQHLTLEEMKIFKLCLKDCDVGFLNWGLLERAGSTEVADILVSSLGEQGAWELALTIWKKMGLRELWERARNGDLALVFDPALPASSDERMNYQERMRKKFQLMRDKNHRPGEHELFQHRFTGLLLLQDYRYKEQKQHELLVQGWKHAEILQERGQLTEVSTLFDPVQNTGTQPYTVVLQGAAGIGKTTLAIKVMLDWAEGNLYQEKFNYVFYFTCRELNPLGERGMSFADLIASDWPGPQAPMTEIMSQPERLLFIIDGLDELKFPCNEHRYDLCKDWKQQRPVSILMSSLLRKTLLPEASLLLTTRLAALGKFSPLLENPRHVEILGFSVEQRREYFCKFFRDKNLGKKVFSLIEENDTLFTMCSVPMMNWIVCTCLKQQQERGQDPIQALKTTTALYMCFIDLITPNDHNVLPQHLRGLCGLAAEGIWERKLLFDEEDLRRHDLEAADVSAFLDMNIFQKDSDYENCYSFIHLSFQEFFAAMFYLMSPDNESVNRPDSSIPDVENLLEECSRNEASFVALVVRFLFGFLNTNTTRKLEGKFRCRMSPEIKSKLLQWAKGETKRDYKPSCFSETSFPEWYSYLYETQDAEFVTQALVNVQEMKVKVSHLYHAQSAVFCMKHCPGAQRISFSYYGLIFVLPTCVWQDLFSVISKNQNLKELKLCCHQFDDSCMENLCAALRHPNCKLERLMLECSHVTYSCGQHLFFALPSNKSLKSLHLKDILFEDDGEMLPCETLRKCQLETLSLVSSELTPECYRDLFSALNGNESLKYLDLSKNVINKKAMKFLCKALKNCKLEKLSLVSSELTPECYRDLFSALNGNESLKYLDLSKNVINKKAMKFLCKALKNCKLEKLRMSGCSLTAVCLQDLLLVISINESLKHLDLSDNSFGDEGIKLLCEALEMQNFKLQTLSVSEDSLSDESKKALTSLKSRISFLTLEATATFFDWDAEETV